MKRVLLLTAVWMIIGLFFGSNTASADSVTFYQNRAAFESALISSATIDFEGIVSDTEFLTPFETTRVFNGVTFTASFDEPTPSTPWLSVTGKSSFLGPFNSALLFHDGSGPITADLTAAGTGFTAVGGTFGDLDHLGRNTTLKLMGTSGVLDVRTLIDADFQLGHTPSFFGWIVQGDTIVSIKHNSEATEAIDNFIFGVAGGNLPPDSSPDGSSGDGSVVPSPSSFAALIGVGLMGLIAVARRRRRKA